MYTQSSQARVGVSDKFRFMNTVNGSCHCSKSSPPSW